MVTSCMFIYNASNDYRFSVRIKHVKKLRGRRQKKERFFWYTFMSMYVQQEQMVKRVE